MPDPRANARGDRTQRRPERSPDRPDARTLRPKLLAWYRRNKRDLPWRRTRDPYRIWLAEVLLQQTQVPTALPYYERFLRRFPTLRSLARATEQEVLKVWQGLGYYRRATNFCRAAQIVLKEHGGHVPSDAAAFAALPGVGRYTAGAVLSIAFGQPLAALDGNAARVIARWMAVSECIDRGPVRRALWEAAERVLSRRSPGNWNQAVMELGSRVCTPRRPACRRCPVRKECLARRRGLQQRIPLRRVRPKAPHIEVGVGIVWRDQRVLLCRRRREAMLGGLWEFPGGKREPGESIQDCIRRELAEECDIDVTVGRHLVTVAHAYSHLRVTLRCYHAEASPRAVARPVGCEALRWVAPQAIGRFPLPAADVRILEALGVRSRRRRAR